MIAGFVAIILAVIVAWVLFWTWVFMICWNAVVPAVFNGPALTFWQAFALSIVVNLLLSGARASVSVKR